MNTQLVADLNDIRDETDTATGLRDCIYGLAVGDALGVPFEFRARDSFECTEMVGHGTHNKPAGTWSDDTSMALAICDSYRQLGRINAADIRTRFCQWLNEGRYTVDGLFDVGNATICALRQGFGCAGEYDNGNGSLMRTAVLAFMGASDDEVREVSAITHAHEVSVECCVEMVHLTRMLAQGIMPKNVTEFKGVAREEISSSGYVLHTWKAARWCLANTSNYADCVLLAVNLGEDTDTTAAVAGALASVYYGMSAIPTNWLATLRGKDIIESCLPQGS